MNDKQENPDCVSVEDLDDFILEGIDHPNRVMAPVQWFGGKGLLARWIAQFLPDSGARVYVEPYSGAASVFWNLPKPYPVEVLNDLDGRIITLFRVLQDQDSFRELAHRLIWTPYSLDEFRRALSILKDWESYEDVDRAWAFFVAMNQAISGTPKTEGNWSRVFVSRRNMAATVNRWRGRLKMLRWYHDRLSRVQLDCRDALDVIRYWDSPETLFYIDPPYVMDTRKLKSAYAHEASDDHHRKLVDLLLQLKGCALLSGYKHQIYEPLEEAGWIRHERRTSCHAVGRTRSSKLRGEGAALRYAARTECLWVSPGAQQRGVSAQVFKGCSG